MALCFLRCAPIRYALQQHNCTCKVFVSVKIHDSASVSSGLLLSSSRVLKNMRPNIQVPHNNGCSAKVVQITVLKIIIISDNYKAMHICITDHTSWLNNYACTYISYCSVKLSLNVLAKPSYILIFKRQNKEYTNISKYLYTIMHGNFWGSYTLCIATQER